MEITKEDAEAFLEKAWKKFQKGRKEHGDDFETLAMEDELEDELLDLAMYALMLWTRRQKNRVKEND